MRLEVMLLSPGLPLVMQPLPLGIGTLFQAQADGRADVRYFHKSNPVNRESILLNGLIPQIGASYEAHSDGKFGEVVFLSSDKNYDSTFDDDLFEVVIDSCDLVSDDTGPKNAFFTRSLIEASQISLVYKGTGESTF